MFNICIVVVKIYQVKPRWLIPRLATADRFPHFFLHGTRWRTGAGFPAHPHAVARSRNISPARRTFSACTHPSVSPAQDSDTHVRAVEFFCHSRARVWRARGIPNSAGGRWGRTGILRAAATRENDRARDRARPEPSLSFAGLNRGVGARWECASRERKCLRKRAGVRVGKESCAPPPSCPM